MKQQKTMPKAKPEEPRDLHPLVVARMEQARANGAGELALRMLRLESALYVAAERRGYAVAQGRITVEDKEIAFEVRQRGRRLYVPTALSLKAWSVEYNPDRRWNDRAGEPLETRLEEIVGGLEELADQIAAAIVARAQAEAEFEQELRDAARRLQKRRERKVQKRRLRNFASDWIEAENIRAFLDAFEARLASHSSPSPALLDWLAWARDYAERFDPLSDRGMVRMQWHAEAVAYEPVDDGEDGAEAWEYIAHGWIDDYLTPPPK